MLGLQPGQRIYSLDYKEFFLNELKGISDVGEDITRRFK